MIVSSEGHPKASGPQLLNPFSVYVGKKTEIFYFHLNPESMLKTMVIVAVSIAILIELAARRTRQNTSLITTP